MLEGRAGEKRMYGITRGRINRATYWVSLVAVIAVFTIVIAFTEMRMPYGEAVLILLCVPRLHDIGRSGWWAGGLIIAEIAVVAGALIALPEDEAMVVLGLFVIVGRTTARDPGCDTGPGRSQPFRRRPGARPLVRPPRRGSREPILTASSRSGAWRSGWARAVPAAAAQMAPITGKNPAKIRSRNRRKNQNSDRRARPPKLE